MLNKSLKIVIISDWFSENMGYAENILPKAMAALGHDVHLVTSTAQIYYSSPTYKDTYEAFLGPNILPAGVKRISNYTLHRLPLFDGKGKLEIVRLYDYLVKLNPQIIQTFDVIAPSTYQAALYCKENSCKLFTESHIHASVFNQRKHIFRKNIFKLIKPIINIYLEYRKLKFIDRVTELCYPIALDVAQIATKHFVVSKNKIKIQSLGVDTDLFRSADNYFTKEERDKLKIQLDLQANSMVCIYTGRFSRDKKPQALAKAVDYLQKQGENIQAIFVGNGTEAEIKEIESMQGCIVHKFVPVKDLIKYYWIADIGVWPSQESTSQLDAAACGLPLILSDRIEVKERVDGNGLLYKEDDVFDLSEKIKILKDTKLREKMSAVGIEKVKTKFSWDVIAQERIKDYKQAWVGSKK